MNAYTTMKKTIALVTLMLFGLNVNAMAIGEDAIETEALRITLNADGTGFIQGKTCDECKLLTVAISAQTKAFDKNTEVPIKQAAGRVGKPATIFINLEHTAVTRIVW
jgi:hypothetical protein